MQEKNLLPPEVSEFLEREVTIKMKWLLLCGLILFLIERK